MWWYLISCKSGEERNLASTIRNEIKKKGIKSITEVIVFGDNRNIFFNKYFAINCSESLYLKKKGNSDTLKKLLKMKNIFKIMPVSEERIKEFDYFLSLKKEKRMEKSNEEVKLGDIVKIKDEKNIFFDHEGTVESITRDGNIVIEIDFFERKVSLKITKDKVENAL